MAERKGNPAGTGTGDRAHTAPTHGAALITGATSGIGLEIARLFARDGHPLVIVSRDNDRLEQTRRFLEQTGSPTVTTIEADLSLPSGPDLVYEKVRKKGITVKFLVNDAGAGEFGPFVETDLQKELDIIQLNVSSLVHLSKLFVRDMLAHGGGRVLQVASIAGYQPTPKLAVYSSTKAFVLSFSDALAHELKDTNVTVTALIPGPTETDFFRKAGMEHTQAAVDDPADPAAVARSGYEGLMNGRRHALGPGMTKQVLMSTMMSNELVSAFAGKLMEPAAPEDVLEKEKMDRRGNGGHGT